MESHGPQVLERGTETRGKVKEKLLTRVFRGGGGRLASRPDLSSDGFVVLI